MFISGPDFKISLNHERAKLSRGENSNDTTYELGGKMK
jgi:hypothetical protein